MSHRWFSIFWFIILVSATRLLAQVGAPGSFEKYEFQPEAWSLPEFTAGDVDVHGNYNTKIDLLSISSPSGIAVPVSFSYSSDIRYADPAGWIGLGWHWNPGSVTRQVVGSLPIFSKELSGDIKTIYEEMLAMGSNGPDLACNIVSYFKESGEKRSWDGLKDIYSFTLPNGSSVKFSLNTSGPGGTVCGGENYHLFQSHGDNSYEIRGYYSVSGAKGRVKQCPPFFVNGITCFPDVVSYDYYGFVIRDASGTQYIFSETTREIYRGKNGLKSEYFNSWRITAVVSPVNVEWIDPINTITMNPQTILFEYTSFEDILTTIKEGHNCNNFSEIEDYKNSKYLIAIKSINEKIEVELKDDNDEDITRYMTAIKNQDMTTVEEDLEFDYKLTTRRRIQAISKYVNRNNEKGTILNHLVFKTENCNGKTFLTSLTDDSRDMYYRFDYFEYYPTDDGFRFNLRKHLFFNSARFYHTIDSKSGRYDWRNCSWDINGYYKRSGHCYAGNLHPVKGQLTSILYPTGKKEKIEYETREIFIDSLFSVRARILDTYFFNDPVFNKGILRVHLAREFGREMNIQYPEGDYRAMSNMVTQGLLSQAQMNRIMEEYKETHSVVSYFGKSLVRSISVYNANGEKSVKTTYEFADGWFGGVPNELNFQRYASCSFIDDQGQLSPLPIEPWKMQRAAKMTGTDNQVWFKKIITRTNKINPVETIRTFNHFTPQEYFLVIGPDGQNRASFVLYSTNAEDLYFEQGMQTITRTADPTEIETTTFRDLSQIKTIYSFPFSLSVDWSAFGKVYGEFPKPHKTITKEKRGGKTAIKSVEFICYDGRAIPIGQAKWIGMNESKDSLEFEFTYSVMGRNYYSQYNLSNQLTVAFQTIQGFFKTRESISDELNFPWNQISDLFPFNYAGYHGTEFVTIPKHIAITSNQVTTSGNHSFGFYPNAVYKGRTEHGLLFLNTTSEKNPSANWKNTLIYRDYNSFGKLISVETDFLRENTYYGSEANPFSENPSANNWYKATGKVISNIEGTVASRLSAKYNNENQLCEAKNDYQSFSFSYDHNGRLAEVWRGTDLVAKNEYNLINAEISGIQNTDQKLNYIKNYKYFSSSPDSFICNTIFHDGLFIVQKSVGSNSRQMVTVPLYNEDWKGVGETVAIENVSGPQFSYDFNKNINQLTLRNLSQPVEKGVMKSNRLSPFPTEALIDAITPDWSDISSESVGYLPYSYIHENPSNSGVRSRKPGADFLQGNAWAIQANYNRDNVMYTVTTDEDRQVVRLTASQIGGRIWNERVLSLHLEKVRLFPINQVNGKIEDPDLFRDDTEYGELNSSTLYYDMKPGYGLFLANLTDLASILPGKNLSIRIRDFYTREIIACQALDGTKDSLVVPLIPGRYYVDMYADFDVLIQLLTAHLGIQAYAFRYEDLKTIQQVSYQYDRYGHVSVVTHPDGRQTRYVTDFWGNVIKKESPYHNARLKNGAYPESDVRNNPDFEYQYDEWGRVRFVIDPNMSAAGKMFYTKYDFLNRPVEVGEMAAGSNFSSVNANNPVFPVATITNTKSSGVSTPGSDTPAAWVGIPTVSNGVKPLQKMYYDLNTTLHGKPVFYGLGRLGYVVEYIPVSGSKYKTIRRYYTYSPEGFCTQVNTTIGIDQQQETYSQHDLMGRFRFYQMKVNNSNLISRWIDYYPMGQVKHLWQAADGIKPPVPTIRYEYDVMGGLQKEIVQGTELRVTLRDIRGWVHQISSGTHFSEELYYHALPEGFQSGSYGAVAFPLHYNGNVAFVKTEQSAFQNLNPVMVTGFNYDEIGRLLSARTLNAVGEGINLYNMDLKYDIMGNILQQSKNTVNMESPLPIQMDDMVYQYADGRLMNVVDRIDTHQTDDYETVRNSIVGSGEAMFMTSKPILETFDDCGVMSGSRPVSETWDAVGFYGLADPATSVSTLAEGGDIVLKLRPNTEYISSSVRSTLQPVTPKRQYILSGKYKGKPYFNGEVNVNPKVYAGIEWLRSNGSRISVKWVVSGQYSASWKNFSGVQAAPDEATHARLLLVNMASPNTEAYFNNIGFAEDGLSYTYDGNGNTIKDLNRNIASIQYNFLNLPEVITRTDQSSVRYGYTWSGQRIMKIIGPDTTMYIRTATGEIAGEYVNYAANTTCLTILGADNSAAGQLRKENNIWKSFFYVKDHLGTIRVTLRMEGATQTVVCAADYYPFGSVSREMNASSIEDAKFRYQGKERDIETGYDYFEARTYDSKLGRFMQVDPMWEKYRFMSTNGFVGNNPIILIDPDGMEIYYSQDGTKLGQVGDNTDIRVINSTTSKKDALKLIEEANAKTNGSETASNELTVESVAYSEYFKTVSDVTNGAALETYKNNNNDCNEAAIQQLANEGVTQGGPSTAINAVVDNSSTINTKAGNSSDLTADPIGASILIQTQLNNGNPVMVGVKETKNDGTVPNPGNTNALTGHFVVIRSSNVSNGIVQFNYLDNASSSSGKSAKNNFTLNTSNGEIYDNSVHPRPNYSNYLVTEVRRNN